MCWGEWGAAPWWHTTGQQEETLRLRLPGFHALSWDLSSSVLLWGEELERCWGSLGSLVLLTLLPYGYGCSGFRVWQGGRGEWLGCETLHETSWHIHSKWNHPWHLGMTGAFPSALGEQGVWSPCWEQPGVKDQAVGNLCSSSTGYLKATARGSTSYLHSASPV